MINVVYDGLPVLALVYASVEPIVQHNGLISI